MPVEGPSGQPGVTGYVGQSGAGIAAFGERAPAGGE
jgi:hypothetical protein